MRTGALSPQGEIWAWSNEGKRDMVRKWVWPTQREIWVWSIQDMVYPGSILPRGKWALSVYPWKQNKQIEKMGGKTLACRGRKMDITTRKKRVWPSQRKGVWPVRL